MRFGIVLPTYPTGATVDGIAQVAKAAERFGFSSAWTTDHVILPPDQAGPYQDIFEALTTVAYVAALTERITLGISVIVVPQRNGVVLAKQLATLDHLCRGRLIIGIGTGWNEPEFAMLGVGDRFHTRGVYLDETLGLWRHLWTQPETGFRSRFYNLPAASFGPPPVQLGGPPFWVGGSSLAARRRAGLVGTAWHPVGISADELMQQSEVVQQAAREAGRPVPEIAPRLPVQFEGTGQRMMTAGNLRVLHGTPAQIIDQLKAYQHAGASEVVILFGAPEGTFVIKQMELFHREVMPALVD